MLPSDEEIELQIRIISNDEQSSTRFWSTLNAPSQLNLSIRGEPFARSNIVTADYTSVDIPFRQTRPIFYAFI